MFRRRCKKLLPKFNSYLCNEQSPLFIDKKEAYTTRGTVLKVTKLLIQAFLPNCHIGTICQILPTNVLVEVIAIDTNLITALPFSDSANVAFGQDIIIHSTSLKIKVNENMLGNIFDGFGNPVNLDLNTDFYKAEFDELDLHAKPPIFVDRDIINTAVPSGVRCIDALLTIGIGQRIGIFAGSGVGKSSLLGMISNGIKGDILILALIGERGREVNEFLAGLPTETKNKTILIVSTSDSSALERMKAAYTATTVAEWYRDKGNHVVLLMDSLTRYARALRDVTLAAGESLVRGGYTSTVFAELPILLERTGPGRKGAITAIYTVLTEDDSINDALGDEIRSLLDGHIFLSRKLAASNFFPAIDINHSTSRVMKNIVSPEHYNSSGVFKSWWSKYAEVELLIRIGEYQRNIDPEMDIIVDKHNEMSLFLKQNTAPHASYESTIKQLISIVS